MWLSYWTYPYNPIIATMGKEIGRSYKYYRSKISNPTLKNLYYHLQQIIHRIQLVCHKLLYHLNLKIKTVLKFKTRQTSQIQMIFTPM